MSVEQDDWGWLQQWQRAVFESQDLSATAKLVMYGLAVHADVDHGNCCSPSQEWLAKGSKKSVKTIQRAIKEGKKAGFIEVHQRQMGKIRLSNFYQLTLPDSTS